MEEAAKRSIPSVLIDLKGDLTSIALTPSSPEIFEPLVEARDEPERKKHGFRPVPETQVVLLGARDFDVDERALLDRSAVSLIDVQRIRKHGLRAALEPLLPKIQTHTGRAYLHIDLDVLDPAEARVNHFAPTGGLTLAELLGIASLIRERFALAATAITAYDPEYDEG